MNKTEFIALYAEHQELYRRVQANITRQSDEDDE